MKKHLLLSSALIAIALLATGCADTSSANAEAAADAKADIGQAIAADGLKEAQEAIDTAKAMSDRDTARAVASAQVAESLSATDDNIAALRAWADEGKTPEELAVQRRKEELKAAMKERMGDAYNQGSQLDDPNRIQVRRESNTAADAADAAAYDAAGPTAYDAASAQDAAGG